MPSDCPCGCLNCLARFARSNYVQLVDRAAEILPASQLLQAVAAELAFFPGEQSVQLLTPIEDETSPLGQGIQLVPSKLLFG